MHNHMNMHLIWVISMMVDEHEYAWLKLMLLRFRCHDMLI